MTTPGSSSETRSIIPRCRGCIKEGVTNINVVAVATEHTKGYEGGDFLCIFHNDKTTRPWVAQPN